MAEIVQSLFGVTPEMYQQQQAAQADARALQFARMSPFEQANFAIGRGASQLVGALGGQDPELQRITMRQQIAQQINYSDPASMQQGVLALQQAGDTQGAMQLQQVLLSQEKTRAETAKAMRERQGADPFEQLVRSGKYTPRSLAAYKQSGDVGQLELMEKPEKGPSFGTDREAVAAEVYDKPFGELSPTERAVVNKRVEEEGGRKAAAGAPKLTNVLPGTKELVDIPKFRSSVQSTIDPQLKAINSADQALTAIEDSLATGNFASYRAAQVQFAKAIAGAGDLSQKELKAAGADPALIGGTADYLSTLFSSTPTKDTQQKIQKTLQAIRKVAANKASAEVEQQRKIAVRSPGYSVEAVNEALTFPELATRSAGGAGSIAEQAAAELARRRAGGR